MELNTTISIYHLIAFAITTITPVAGFWYNTKTRMLRAEWELAKLKTDFAELKQEQESLEGMFGKIMSTLQDIKLELKDKADRTSIKENS